MDRNSYVFVFVCLRITAYTRWENPCAALLGKSWLRPCVAEKTRDCRYCSILCVSDRSGVTATVARQFWSSRCFSMTWHHHHHHHHHHQLQQQQQRGQDDVLGACCRPRRNWPAPRRDSRSPAASLGHTPRSSAPPGACYHADRCHSDGVAVTSQMTWKSTTTQLLNWRCLGCIHIHLYSPKKR